MLLQKSQALNKIFLIVEQNSTCDCIWYMPQVARKKSVLKSTDNRLLSSWKHYIATAIILIIFRNILSQSATLVYSSQLKRMLSIKTRANNACWDPSLVNEPPQEIKTRVSEPNLHALWIAVPSAKQKDYLDALREGRHEFKAQKSLATRLRRIVLRTKMRM